MTRRGLHPFLVHDGPIPFAHRGGSLEAEENTMPAFEHAVALGYGHVELDVHLTADGEVVIHHDPTLARVFGVDRAVAALTMADLATIRSPGGATVPRLADLLHAFPRLKVNIEAKSDDVVGPLAEVIRQADALERICIGSFNPSRTAAARAALGPGLCWSPAHWGVARLWAAGWGLPLPVGFPVAQVPLDWKGIAVITPRFLRAAHRRGIPVQVWTVNDAPMMEHLLDLGIDGIMTDRPTLLREVLQRRGQWRAG
ncbi:glycerophosphodiester phosphodiesterase [Gemmobacter nectariphilus]|uniref:glycerophosphodiester phosphodiesterase n=1 Tax=Gemmobacter nectariphilus TaxID=220343 RepID=UPI00048916BC|nr:glycerophosphodiester phosphodiesterase [Gemmobacter nectariphilus]